MQIDLHTHSAFSDGTDSVPHLLQAARAAALDVIALTDHDTMQGVAQAQQLGRSLGVTVLRGVEMSAHVPLEDGRQSVHLLGYGCRSGDIELTRLLDDVRNARVTRVPKMLAKLAELGLPVELAEVEAQATRAVSTGRPHIADAMVARGYVASRDEAFRDYLRDNGPAYVRRYTPTLEEAIDTINAAGGVAVVAHPWSRGAAGVVTAEAIADLVREHGLFGIEADHVDHEDDARAALRVLADDLGLVATGSSDYHGTGKTRNPLGVFRTSPEAYEKICDEVTRRGGQL